MEEALLAIVNSIELNLIVVLIKVIIVAGLSMIIYNVLTSWTKYVIFRFNKHISIGAEVRYQGEMYMISGMNAFFITIEDSDGIVQIPVIRWSTIAPKLIIPNKDKLNKEIR